MSASIRNWPSREQWAYSRQHPYWDGETGCPFANKYGHQLSDYATQEEIAALIAALKDLYRELGRELQAANLRIKPSDRQQRGEGNSAWYRRFRQLAPEDQALFQAAGGLRSERSAINNVLARIRDDQIPNQTRWSNYVLGKAGELVAPFNARYQAAFEAAREQWEQECLQIPVDDAAWEQELKWRRDLEERGTVRIVHSSIGK
jgi:hypothetical protein